MPLGIAAVNMSAHNLKALLLHGLLGPPVTGTQFSRDNHYVPRTYLRRWADASGRIWVYRLLVPHARSADWKPASSKGVAFRQHLYTRAVAGGLTDQVEHWLDSEYESPAADALQKVWDGSRLTPQDWVCLVRFLAAQDVRTPARMVEILNGMVKTLPELVQSSLEETVAYLEGKLENGEKITPLPVDPESRAFPARMTTHVVDGADHGFIKYEVTVGRSLWHWNMKELLSRTASVLLTHRWTILHCPKGMHWITSDDPVIKLNYYGEENYDFKGGWGSVGTEIFMPLTPKHLLYTKVGERPPPRGHVVPTWLAELLQRFSIEHASRLVLANWVDPTVSSVRPRAVDPAQHRDEQQAWARWHEEQVQAEKEIFGI